MYSAVSAVVIHEAHDADGDPWPAEAFENEPSDHTSAEVEAIPEEEMEAEAIKLGLKDR